MEQGDMILHSYDLLHCVDVRGGTRRSLIMWISSDAGACAAESTPWKARDARRGNMYAQYQLGRAVIFGQERGGATRGWRWVARAAQQGHPTAQLNWGLEEIGRGKIRSARRLWTLAARQGLSEAAHNLGIFYLSADGGLAVNQTLGLRWLRHAALRGSSDSVEKLAGCLTFRPPCAA
eukprot:TRINITY_DN32711_c0_g1_i1.p1 TRINITY_DN32711_c0_g1~~TRINITY_DN32711_c0_g1_i1.p1  ORF type:complete len:190 (-),score=13.25 TRINITY_DN32711_c0_g1_i1:28-561(-)